MKIQYLTIIIFYIIFTILSQIQTKQKIDEYFNHYPTVLEIYKNGLFETIRTDNYKAANTPLPYLLSLMPYKISGKAPDIKSLRIFNILIAALCLLIIIKYTNHENKFISLGLVFFYPYFLKTAFTYYMAIYGLLFFFITLVLMKIKNETSWKWFLVGLSTAAAILSQQFYLILIPSFLLYILFFDGSNNKNKALQSFNFFMPSLLFTLPIFILWNGLTHPHYSFHQVKPDLTKLTSLLLVSGCVLIFYFLSIIKNLDRKIFFFFLVISLLLNALLYPEFSEKGGFEKITGYTFHLIHVVEKFNYYLSFLFKFLLVSVGLYGIYSLLKIMYNKNELFYFILLIMLIAGFIFNVLLAERHLLPLVVFIIIYSSVNIKSERLLKLWYTFQVIFGVGYFIYYLYYQPNY